MPARLPNKFEMPWKRDSIKRSTFSFSAAIKWIQDKDNRAFLGWSSSVFGGALVVGYFFIIRETPIISLGQLPLLLIQAFLIGLFLTVYLSYLLMAPVWGYEFALDIDADLTTKEKRPAYFCALMSRNFTCQVLIASAFTIYFSSPFTQAHPSLLAWVISSECFIFAGIFIFFLERTDRFGRPESNCSYFGSICILSFLGFISSLSLFLLHLLVPADQRATDSALYCAWIITIGFSSIFSVFGRSARIPKLIVPFVALGLVLVILNGISVPFKITAYTIGIAEAKPVTLIFPQTTCIQVKEALSAPSTLNCSGDKSGVLKEVNLLTRLGERWSIQVGEKQDKVTFDGKGVVVRRENATQISVDK